MRIVCLVSIGGLAVLWDFYSRRIPNQLTGTGFLAALAWQWSANGPPGIFDFFAGAITPVIVLGILHYFKMLGSGDLKYFMVIGGFLDPRRSLKCICSFISDCCYDFSGSDYQISYLKKTSISMIHYVKKYIAQGSGSHILQKRRILHICICHCQYSWEVCW